MDYNKFKVGDLVRWNPNEYDILAGDTKEVGIVIEIGERADSIAKPLQRYALINWVASDVLVIMHGDTSWDKTEVLARADNV